MTLNNAIIVAAFLALAAPVAAAEQTLSPLEARDLAARALANGYPQDTVLLTEGLLVRDPGDISAHLLRAEAASAMGEFAVSLDHASTAFGLSENDEVKFQAARLIALAHARLDHPTRAQFWLRRARALAPENKVEQLAEDYRFVRQRNPLSLKLDLAISPSSNVNNGSSESTIAIPGMPFDAPLSADAQALSGTVASARVSLGYRLEADRTSATTAKLTFGGTAVALSDEAQSAAPSKSGSDYAHRQVSGSLIHNWRMGEVDYALDGTLGYSTYGGDPFTSFQSVSLTRGWRMGENVVSAKLGRDWTTYLSDDVEAATWSLHTALRHPTDMGRLTVWAEVKDTVSASASRSVDAQSVGLAFDLSEPVAGMDIAFSYRHDWRAYGANFLAPDGRDDNRDTLTVSAGLPALDLYGFHPVLNLQASRNNSNVALHETEELSVGVGIESSF
ncbi:tetratricopeptide repeat protein [Marivivens aquimaris]|uniref:hypothetical protein n=1 Tax=Marivivens aquimaris TaxID=2774876 RepID=UPI00187FB038|nr:hypothetical protein [Marivivens aquimaris]